MSKSERPPVEIVESIKDESANVRQAASNLTDRISRFRTYLSRLKGRVETEVYGRHPNADQFGEHAGYPVSLGIRLHRVGQEWELSFGVDDDPNRATEWKPLIEAPLNFKIAAIKLFPDLLLAIEKSQKKLTSEIIEASREFDEFAAALGIPEEEESPGKPDDLTTRMVSTVRGRRAIQPRSDDLSAKWNAAIASLSDHGPALSGLLTNGRLVRIEDGWAVIRYQIQHETFVKLLMRNGKKEIVRQALSKVVGQALDIRFEISDPSTPGLPPKAFRETPKEGT